jgi:hypothetical protein
VTGGDAYLQDVRLPGMLFGRVDSETMNFNILYF